MRTTAGQRYTGRPRRHPGQLRALDPAALLIALLLISSMFIGEGGGAAPADAVLLLAAGHVLLSMRRAARTSPGISEAIARMSYATAGFLVVALLSMLLHGGDVAQLVTDMASFLYILTTLALLGSAARTHDSRVLDRLTLLIAVLGVVFAAVTLSQSTVRGTGLMANPNMAAVWLGLALIAVGVAPTAVSVKLRLATVGLLLAALVATDSYSALLGLGFVGSYLLIANRHRVAAAGVALAGLAVVWLYWSEIVGAVSSPERLANSEGARSLIWGAAWRTWESHPWGIGHGNFVREGIYNGVQTHNDYLAALVEQSYLGVLALVGIGLAIWRSGRRVTRAMLIFVAFTAFFHNVINFRHIWIFIAVAIALDLRAARESRQEPRPSTAGLLP